MTRQPILRLSQAKFFCKNSAQEQQITSKTRRRLLQRGLIAVFAGQACNSFSAQEKKVTTILVFGDSLSAGYGISQEAAWPSLLQKRLSGDKKHYKVINASISGETSAGGLARIREALDKHQPRYLILALGANDGLRGLPLPLLRQNLREISQGAKSKACKVLLVGMRLPPNYGPYATEFQQIFHDVAKKESIPLVEFLLEGIADKPELFQPDQLHPIASAQPRILDNVWRGLEPILR